MAEKYSAEMDFSQFNDEELEALAGGDSQDQKKDPSFMDMTRMSDQELERLSSGQDPWAEKTNPQEYIQHQERSGERPWYDVKAENLVPGFFKGLENIDSVTGAPIRKFVTEAVTGEDFDKAPTGAEQAKMLGASDTSYEESWGVPSYLGGDVSPADIYGVGLDMVQDPLVIAGAAIKSAQALGRGVKGVVSPSMKQTAKISQSQSGTAAANSSAKTSANISGGGIEVEQTGELFEFKAPQSLDELKSYKPPAGQGVMLGKKRLKEIESTVPDLQTKPLKYHYDMMENPKSMKELKLQFENLPTDDAKRISAYNKGMVDESELKINQTVEEMAGAKPKSLGDAGDDLIGTVKKVYEKEKSTLGPVFERVKETAQPLSPERSKDLILYLGENTKLGKLLSVGDDGRFYLKKNTPRTGLADDEYKALSRVVDDLNDGMSFKEIQETREFLRKAVDPANPGASAEINKVRSLLLGKLEDMSQSFGDDVGATFKSYAVNERARESLEKIIGGKVDTLDAMFAANPQKVVNKIFSNPNYTKIVEDYVGSAKMNELKASYIQSGIDKATDSAKGFSPEKFRNWLKSNKTFIDNNLSQAAGDRLNALADYGYYGKRFLDEVNPSGTAASLQAMIEPKSFMQKVSQKGIVGGITSEIGSRASSVFNQRSAIKSVNEMLGTPRKDYSGPLRRVKKVANKAISKGPQIAGINSVLRASGRNTEKKDRGKAKWAQDGLKSLEMFFGKEKAQQFKAFVNDKKGMELLARLSSLRPGSKAYQHTVKQLEKLRSKK